MSRKFDIEGTGGTWDFNPYSNPGRCGLEILGVLEDPGACYSFDTLVVWIDLATSKLYAARDSGCSCPTPFEDYRETGQFTEVRSYDDVEGLISTYAPFDSADRFALRRQVESYLSGMKLANEAVDAFTAEMERQAEPCDLDAILASPEVWLSVGSAREEELLTELDNARETMDTYLAIIRDQGRVLQSVRLLIGTYTDRETGR